MYYGRQQLAAEDSRLVQAYDYLGQQVNDMVDNVVMYRYFLTTNEFEKVLRYYHDDHPEVYWLNLSYSYNYVDMADPEKGTIRYIYAMQQEYSYTAADVAANKVLIEERAQELLCGITDEMPSAERVRLVHDRLILSASYDTTYEAPHTHDLMGVMLEKTGVCESYARAFQYLMYRCGINTILQVGQLKGSTEHHMWNVIDLDGEWYQIDTTWNDPVFSTPNPNYIRYNYYNVTDAQIGAERAVYRVAAQISKDGYLISYPYPSCTATAENYYVKYAVDVDSFRTQIIAEEIARSILANDEAVFRPTGSYTVSKLDSDLKTYFQSLMIRVNALLPADKQLVTPGYFFTPVDAHGVLAVHIRNY